MRDCVAWLDEQPIVEIGPSGVRLSYTSGDVVRTIQMSRAYYREYLETNLRRLNEFERADRERHKVIKMERTGHG